MNAQGRIQSGASGMRLRPEHRRGRTRALPCLAYALAWLMSGVAMAETADPEVLTAEPRAIIDDTADRIIVILADKDRSEEERIEAIERIAYELFDFETMSKLVLARNWRKLDREQRVEFVHEFKRHLSRTYGSRLDRYDQERVEVYDAQIEPRNDVTIKTRIVGGEFNGSEVSYRLRRRNAEWRIIDVVIEGVSLVSNYRSQFAEVLSGGTIDDLLARLRDKNFQVDDEDAGEGSKDISRSSVRR